MRDVDAFSANPPVTVVLQRTRKFPWGLCDVLTAPQYQFQVCGSWLVVWKDGIRIAVPVEQVDYIITRPLEVEHVPAVRRGRPPKHPLPPTPQALADGKAVFEALGKRGL